MEKHTPGPWIAVGVDVHDKTTMFDRHGSMIGDTANRITRVEYPYDSTMGKVANARLIAAAPDMLAALKATEDRLSAWRDSHEIWYRQTNRDEDKNAMENCGRILCAIRSAIAKAEGRE
jgi:hypothetical protein